jgi:hypothetical protein
MENRWKGKVNNATVEREPLVCLPWAQRSQMDGPADDGNTEWRSMSV